MVKVDYLILGGGIAGTTAAETIRNLDPNGRIVVIDRERQMLYSRVILPEYLSGQLPLNRVMLRRAEQYADKHIELVYADIERIDFNNRVVGLKDGREISYQELLIALGTEPRRVSVPGGELDGIHNIYSLEDCDKILSNLSNVHDIFIVGGGFIGLEAYEAFVPMQDKKVTMLLREPWYFFPKLDPMAGQIIQTALTANGVNLIIEDQVTEFIGHDRVEMAKTQQGKEIPCQLVIEGVGVKRRIGLFHGSDLRFAEEGVSANQFMQTNLPHVWAAGDIANFVDLSTGQQHSTGTWANAAGHGRTAGVNMTKTHLNISEPLQEFNAVNSYTVIAPGINMTLIGNVDDGPGYVMITKTEEKCYTRLIIDEQNNRIDGAIILNDIKSLATIKRLMFNHVDIEQYIPMLKKSNRSFGELLKDVNI